MKWEPNVIHRTILVAGAAAVAACTGASSDRRVPGRETTRTDSSAGAIATRGESSASSSPAAASKADGGAANHEGRIPVLEYHLIGDKDSRWGRSRENFRKDLELLYDRGYRPMTVGQMLAKDFSAIPAGKSPVIFTF